jgi:hypothetical protein
VNAAVRGNYYQRLLGEEDGADPGDDLSEEGEADA